MTRDHQSQTGEARASRGQWGSKIGFILAASGSAIGLGNIVFFGANAYRFGAGAFYLPYLVALFVVGIPVLMTELGLGSLTQRAFPESLGKIAGPWGEFAGWWGLINAGFITMYYVTILAWVCGMFVGALGPLWKETAKLPHFAMEEMATPTGYFFQMISSWWVIGLVVLVWLLNLLIVRKGVSSIEQMVKIFVPLMWVFMGVLIVRGLTLPHGPEGIYLLFTPNFDVMGDPQVWQGAVSQIFFSLTLGFGVMTAYASYLPKDSDQVNNATVTACLNCGFEFVAGVAIFAFLFAFAIVPQASTLAMMFFVVPEGIASMPGGVIAFGLMFFFLLLIAGLSSSISLLEGLSSALIDKFAWPRRQTLMVIAVVGIIGSIAFAMPVVIDPQLNGNGTFGLSLLDVVDHWAFSHGLILIGLVECLILGWKLPVSRLRENLNRNSKLKVPAFLFDWLIKLVIPAALVTVLATSIVDKLQNGLYGWNPELAWGQALPLAGLIVWLAGTCLTALWLTQRRPARPAEGTSAATHLETEEVRHA
jgi:NSS family neurotransmitter:Na+ symporter